MDKEKITKNEEKKDLNIEVVYIYKEIEMTAQNALENYLSNIKGN